MEIFKNKISKEEVNGMDVESFKGRIYIVNNVTEANRVLDIVLKCDAVGLDTETRPSFKKGKTHNVSLLQIATDDVCWLFRLNSIGYPESLARFFENEKVVKIGLSLKDDFRSLHRSIGFEPKSYVELQNVISDYGIEEKSLQKIYAILFGKKISKSQRLSNWDADELTDRQQAYAALDAWSCLKIYNKLEQMKATHDYRVEQVSEAE